jgi:hypothetical protein
MIGTGYYSYVISGFYFKKIFTYSGNFATAALRRGQENDKCMKNYQDKGKFPRFHKR